MAEPLGQMMIELGLDDTKFGNGLKNAKSQLKYFGSEMKAQASFYDTFGRKVDGLSAKEQGLTKMIASQSKVVAESKKAYDGSLTSKGQMTKSSARLAASFEAEQAKLAALAKEYINTAKAEAEMKVKTTGLTGAVNKFGTAQIAIGSRMKSIGDRMTTSVTVPIATAFVAATAKAMAFQNKLLVIKNLLTTGGESAQEAISGVNQMQSDAIKYSNKYGVSVTKISDGYEELVRRGYTSKQAIAAMKTELQGSLASGDDFSDVVSVASSTLESFGMKANDTATMTKNTKTAINELAYAADLTATDFQSLGVGMSYVGATAHQAHFTLSETAAALGVLSNNGVEADKAGTGLRKVIVSMNTAVKNIGTKNDVLASLGIKKEEIVGSNGQLKSLSTIMEVLNQHTKDMSSTKKAAVFNSLFGTTGQQAGIILAQNSKQLSELNDQVDKAEKKNYVGSLSEKNLKSAQNQLKVLKQNVENLGMTLAQKVLPSVQPLIKDATQAVNWFSKLNPAVQQNIIKWGALAAAMGPVLSIAGRLSLVSGKTATGLVGIISKLAGLNAKSKATQDVIATLTDGAGKTIGTLTRSGDAAEKVGLSFGGLASKLVTTTEGAGGLGFALTPLGIGLAATAAAVVVAGVAWEAWGKKAYEAKQRADKWGTSVDAATDKSATDFQNFETKATVALNNTTGSAKDNANRIDKAFNDMLSSAEQNITTATNEVNEAVKTIGGDVGKDTKKDAKEQLEKRKSAVKEMKELYKESSAITDSAVSNNKRLSADQTQVLENLQTQMAADWVKTLNVSENKQKQILKVMKGNYSSLSEQSLLAVNGTIYSQFNKENDDRNKSLNTLKKLHSEGLLENAEYNNKVTRLNDEFYANNKSAITAYLQTQTASIKKSADYRSKDAMTRANIDKALIAQQKDYLTATLGLSNSEADAIMKAATAHKKAAKTTTVSLDGLTGKAKKAAMDWNNLVFDYKTGSMKTNAQEEVNKAVASSKDWENIKLLAKSGNMTTNASEMVANALLSQKRWDDIKFLMKTAHLNADTKKAIADAYVANGKWEYLSFKEKKMLAVSDTNKALMKSLKDSGEWNKLPMKVQAMIATSKTASGLKQSLKDMGVWNGLPSSIKHLIARDEASQAAKAAVSAVKKFAVLQNRIYKDVVVRYSETGKSGAARAIEAKGEWWKKNGSRDFKGGPAIVNDQKGPLFREAIIHPNGFTEIPFGHNVFRYVEKHAQIVPAGITARMFADLPQFANGYNIPANANALTMADSITHSLSGPQTLNVNALNSNAGVETILDSIKAMLAILMQRETTIDVDGRTLAQVQYPYLSTIDTQQKRAKNRRKGYTG
ncbi:phage tail tape measure protein [Lacticaseibacillus sp. 53-4]|uniref:phage tail tape measure protein n=1 Tax=Lacticaseibacillus sp. 53-4 TaxID=2799575 RepID=UPI0019425A91|nr:phage tail tape measure protein [Lacticaseibacillus sp. 53-4]